MPTKLILTPAQQGAKAARKAIEARLKIGRNPFRIAPSRKTMSDQAENWDEFMRGWIEEAKQFKKESADA